jgi:hypothetical protein
LELAVDHDMFPNWDVGYVSSPGDEEQRAPDLTNRSRMEATH